MQIEAEQAARIDDFDFHLPKERIALRPVMPRDSARLLIVKPGAKAPLAEAHVRDLPDLLCEGDAMVFNNTKVLPAELSGVRPARGPDSPSVPVSLTLIERLADGRWKALARPGRRLREGDELVFTTGENRSCLIIAEKGKEGEIIVAAMANDSIEAVMARHGAAPLPPYISRERPADARDNTDYQTVYAEEEGAVAAPTAGLHFTEDLLKRLAAKGVREVFATLHVGAGTFLPVKAEDIDAHRLHAERCEIGVAEAEALNKARVAGGRIVAVGTTSLRLLETAAQVNGAIAPYSGETRLFIRPGYRFRSADLLMTNFHLPKSTLFMLVCAFSGTELMREAYRYAIKERFRFYSYGDACLLHRAHGGTA